MISQKIFRNKNDNEILKLTIEDYDVFSTECKDKKAYMNLEEYLTLNAFLNSLEYIELVEIKEEV